MWNNYFRTMQEKYSMRVSSKEPLVIRLDGKGVTRNKELNLLDRHKGSFTYNIEKTVEYFTQKYKCLSIFGSDEVSFIFDNPEEIIIDLDKEKNNRSNEIIAMFCQYFFDYFNNLNKNQKTFWHGKCFSIPRGKVNSYLKYRSKIIKNVMTTYFLKKRNVMMGNSKMEEKEIECKKYGDYSILERIQDGILYYNGKEINLNEYYEGNIVFIEKENNINEIKLDLLDF